MLPDITLYIDVIAVCQIVWYSVQMNSLGFRLIWLRCVGNYRLEVNRWKWKIFRLNGKVFVLLPKLIKIQKKKPYSEKCVHNNWSGADPLPKHLLAIYEYHWRIMWRIVHIPANMENQYQKCSYWSANGVNLIKDA